MNHEPLQRLFQTVVAGGYCIGCGACTLGENESPIEIRLDELGMFQARLKDSASHFPAAMENLLSVCPFAENTPTEDEHGKRLYGAHATYDSHLGYVIDNYAGHVAEGEFRAKGSSGGMGSWILCQLLERKLVDAIVHVQPRDPTPDDRRVYQFGISRTIQEVRRWAKSQYYPIEMSEVLRFIKGNAGRYALIGVPCFIKAIRNLSLHDPVLAERVRFCIALFCGHLKSMAFSELFAWQCDVPPDRLKSIDFRRKDAAREASDYGVKITGETASGQPVEREAINRELYGTSWGLGFFKYKACDYCDDVVGETADLSVGDAWLPEYVKDGMGTNVVTVRHPALNVIVKEGIADGRLAMHPISAKKVIDSQDAGFRHRRDGLSYRLQLADEATVWHPPKRVKPGSFKLDWRYKKIHQYRVILARESHLAWQKAKAAGRFQTFVDLMHPLVLEYSELYRRSRLEKAISRARSVASKIKKKLIGSLRG